MEDFLQSVARTLRETLETFRTSHGTPAERLYGAWISHAGNLQAEDFPDDLAPRWVALEGLLRNHGTWKASADAMSAEQMGLLIAEVERLANEMDGRARRG